jgi:DNA polymerase-4
MHMQDLNPERPKIMHIDLNSAFASTEQQSRPTLRGRPVGVTNRISKNCCMITVSYEAKAVGVKVGMGLKEARAICPDIFVVESDPPKYHHMYKKIAGIMQSYSPLVEMKSIDEGIIDFTGTTNKKSLVDIGLEIKNRVKQEMGCYMRVNIGIGPNRFLAKQAAGWHKPDGLDVLDAKNVIDYYKIINLVDITGIASRYEARLNAAGIYTPLQFFGASSKFLQTRVFGGIVGDHWHKRLRGYEIDDRPTRLGIVGRQWVLSKPSNEDSFILPCFHYLCETTGKKLRYNSVDARGVLVWARFTNGQGFVLRKMFKSSFYTDKEVYRRALLLFNRRPRHMKVQAMGISCYGLSPSKRSQLSMFESFNKEQWLTEAVDEINDRYGNFTICSANAMAGKQLVKQKIPFGGTKYFELLLKRA